VRGVGLMCGMELVHDKATRQPFDPELKVGAMVERYARAQGLIARFIGDRIALAPPLIITEPEIDDLGQRLRHALDATWAELRV